MSSSRESRVVLAALASALAIPGVPVLLVLAFLADHIASFRGTCGPYAPDISAYPCGFAQYLVNFASPFAMAGLIGLSIIAAVLTTMVLLLAWTVAAIAWSLTRARSSTPSRASGRR